jgi:uncharacterized protein YkwD
MPVHNFDGAGEPGSRIGSLAGLIRRFAVDLDFTPSARAKLARVRLNFSMSAQKRPDSTRTSQFPCRRIPGLPYVHTALLLAPAWWSSGCSPADSTPVTLGQGGTSPAASGGNTSTGQGGATATATGGNSQGGVISNNGGTVSSTGGTAASTGGATVTTGGTLTTGGTPSTGGSAMGKGGAIGSGGASGGTAGKASTGGSTTATGGSGGAASTGGAATGERGTTEGVCARWKADRANLSEGTWSGSVDTCTAGDISADGRANALRLYNLYRWLGNMPAVVTDPTRDAQAQACALMQYANGTLSHEPPTTWKCYTEEGAKGSGSSNISGGPGVSSVDAYMVDNGNATTLGHRRWILSNSLGPIGLGSTGKGSSCMQNLNGTGKAGKPWIAWPPQGIVPIQAFGNAGGRGGGTIDTTGWMVQSDTINLTGAQVAVMANGAAAAVTVTALGSGYGSRYAFRFNPSGWTSKAGTTYAVSVTGIPTPISYEVEVVDCP